jgi:hypothetical protein
MNDSSPALSDAQRRTLSAVLDELIPPHGKLAGAGALGVGAHVERSLGNAPELRAMILQGLQDLETTSHEQHGTAFGGLSQEQKVALLNQQGFLFPLLLHAYIGYYQHPAVANALGIGAAPPHPRGYELEGNDLSLLDEVRRRGMRFRDI